MRGTVLAWRIASKASSKADGRSGVLLAEKVRQVSVLTERVRKLENELLPPTLRGLHAPHSSKPDAGLDQQCKSSVETERDRIRSESHDGDEQLQKASVRKESNGIVCKPHGSDDRLQKSPVRKESDGTHCKYYEDDERLHKASVRNESDEIHGKHDEGDMQRQRNSMRGSDTHRVRGCQDHGAGVTWREQHGAGPEDVRVMRSDREECYRMRGEQPAKIDVILEDRVLSRKKRADAPQKTPVRSFAWVHNRAELNTPNKDVQCSTYSCGAEIVTNSPLEAAVAAYTSWSLSPSITYGDTREVRIDSMLVGQHMLTC